MDDELLLILLGLLVVIGLPVIALSAFVMVLGLRRRVTDLEARLAQWPSPVAPGSMVRAPDADATDQTAAMAPVAMAPTPQDPAPADSEATLPPVPRANDDEPTKSPVDAVTAEPAAIPVAARKESLEEQLGARWAVWVGGVALALGGVFLVRYSIEAGLLGPGARITAGLLFALALIAAGEWLRRREQLADFAQMPAAHIPGVVTAAGTVALFGTLYAAHALYGLIGATTAFVGLGLVGVLAMAAAALHGPWLAGLGLVGAYATPLLVSSDQPNPWALTIYLAVVTATAFALARLRLWRWLAIAASVGALGWGLVMAAALIGVDEGAVLTHVLVVAALVIGVLGLEAHRSDGSDETPDVFALLVMLGVAGLALVAALSADFSVASIGAALVIAVGLLAAALAVPALAPAAGIAAALAVGLAVEWPVVAQSLVEPMLVIPDFVAFGTVMPQAASLYSALFAAAGIVLFGATTRTIERRAQASYPAAIAWALAGTVGPLLLLGVAYIRLTAFTANLMFGALGLAAASLLAVTTTRFLNREASGAAPAASAAASIHAAAATAALALALTMTLAGSTLTLAFALAALGSAWVAMLRPMTALRWSAVAFTVLVVGRGGGSWSVIGEVMTTFPGWTDIALRFALPALAIGLGGVLLRRRASDAAAAFLDSGSILLGAAAGCLAIRLWIQGPEAALTGRITLLEAGLYATLFLAMAAGFARGALTSGSLVHRIAAPVSAVAAIAIASVGLLIVRNPLVTGDPIVGGALINELAAGLALPALLAALLHWVWSQIARRQAPPVAAGALAFAAGALSLVLALLFVTAETRWLVRGDMAAFDVTTEESYAYSAVWLTFGIILLAGGLILRSTGARAASALVILLTVAKVFLLDMSGLEGVWRALSFIGLGLVLIGIGLVYQRLLFGARKAATVPPGGADPASPDVGQA